MTEPTKFKAWITQYALTQGIFEIDAEDCFDISTRMIADVSVSYRRCHHTPDWHRTRAEAVVRAIEMRNAKAASLKKQLARIEKLEFNS